jgi:hypothetical protein
MPRNLRLRLIEDLDEIANADLARRHQVQKAQPRRIGERLEERDETGFHSGRV